MSPFNLVPDQLLQLEIHTQFVIASAHLLFTQLERCCYGYHPTLPALKQHALELRFFLRTVMSGIFSFVLISTVENDHV